MLINKMKRVASYGQCFYYHIMKTFCEAFVSIAWFWKQSLRWLKKFDDNARKTTIYLLFKRKTKLIIPVWKYFNLFK